MEAYIRLEVQHSAAYLKLNKQYRLLSLLRLLSALGFVLCLFYFFKTDGFSFMLLSAAFIALAAFVLFMKIHGRVSFNREIAKTLVRINKDEISYLRKEDLPFADGLEYLDPAHPYAHDLDIFGRDSLFQHLNRTATFTGKEKLSALLLSKLPGADIQLNQQAIRELARKIDWRQKLLALAKNARDHKAVYEKLLNWSGQKVDQLPGFLIFASYASPVLLFSAVLLYYFTEQGWFALGAAVLFFLNLLLLGSQLNKIKHEILGADKIHETIKGYSLIMEAIEKETFEAPKLNDLKKKLRCEAAFASDQVRKLSVIYANMYSILNGVAAFVLNGFFLYHIHNLQALQAWKKKFSAQVPEWLAVTGELEALNSLANFSCNNPAFTFPALNDEKRIVLQEVGHPLIKASTRVANSVEFDSHRFIILTGSNMAGKSTFLRTLGINLVLAGSGAPVCASFADIHPLDILASMRLSDSLSDSESYFYAEVKRLKQIMDRLDEKACFVLLDEILRGTNSDDKRSGTIEVIRKMVSKGALGVIATHDLEVCLTAQEYPEALVNKCFEVETLLNDLSFDYKLRDGVCQSKSATFIMTKMGVI